MGGLVLSFTFFTLLGSTILTLLGLPQDFIRIAGIVALVLIGIAMMIPRLMEILEKPFTRFGRSQGKRPDNGFLLGIVLGAAYVPCAGPVLAAVSVAGTTGRIGPETVALALSFAIGTGIPLLAFALAGRGLTERIAAFRSRQKLIRIIAGAAMILLAIGLATDLPAKIQRALPDWTSSLQAGTDKYLRDSTPKGSSSTTCLDGADELANCGPLPKIEGAVAWFNTPGDQPLTETERKGKVTLVDFWAYSCINCQRSIPGVEKLYETYKDASLQVIGVHSPEYAFEKEVDNVKKGAESLGITYPVAVESDLVTWTNFDNHYWPAHYLADAKGELRALKYGEGGEATTEKLVRRLLTEANPDLVLPAPVFASDEPTATGERSPETYLGAARASRFVDGGLIRAGHRDPHHRGARCPARISPPAVRSSCCASARARRPSEGGAGCRRLDAVAFVAALMIVTASGRRLLDEAEEADRGYRELISRGLPPVDGDEVAMLWSGGADGACARYRRRSGASGDDARIMIRLAAKMAAAEGRLPQ